MALSGAKHELAGLGQFGSIFVDTPGVVSPPADYVICAITFLSDSTFHTTNGMIPENNKEDESNFIKTITTAAAADPSVTVTNNNGSHSQDDGVEGSGGNPITSSDTFPKGITVFGRWIELKHATGIFIAYLAPKH
tara:strand:- start:60 stop:467 length:408 start_codon:yes stop_codon:yes gene_type:complete